MPAVAAVAFVMLISLWRFIFFGVVFGLSLCIATTSMPSFPSFTGESSFFPFVLSITISQTLVPVTRVAVQHHHLRHHSPMQAVANALVRSALACGPWTCPCAEVQKGGEEDCLPTGKSPDARIEAIELGLDSSAPRSADFGRLGACRG
ncbi:hypothetical protein BJV78DRAFT_1198212 [Lactifluus subvellereus]|nr:hypothetical protein BJV78DRAFT_1198212 [Lactifluus subvellereus]